MSPSDVSWLHFWEALSTFGFVLVIIGCVVEGVEHFKKFKRGENPKKHLIEKIGWFILIGGLAIEFLAENRAKRIADRENTRLTSEAAMANERAGSAEKLAGKANERAALTDSNNLVLRSNLVALELKLQDRRISWEQTTNFIFLSEDISKIPIRIVLPGSTGSESLTFAHDIRHMLTQAGFGTNGAVSDIGIEELPMWNVYRHFGATNSSPVTFLIYSTNRTAPFRGLLLRNPEKRNRPVVESTNEFRVYDALASCFEGIGIPVEWMGTDIILTPGQCAIQVTPR